MCSNSFPISISLHVNAFLLKGVSVEAVDPVFQAKMLDMLKQTGRQVLCYFMASFFSLDEKMKWFVLH